MTRFVVVAALMLSATSVASAQSVTNVNDPMNWGGGSLGWNANQNSALQNTRKYPYGGDPLKAGWVAPLCRYECQRSDELGRRQPWMERQPEQRTAKHPKVPVWVRPVEGRMDGTRHHRLERQRSDELGRREPWMERQPEQRAAKHAEVPQRARSLETGLASQGISLVAKCGSQTGPHFLSGKVAGARRNPATNAVQ